MITRNTWLAAAVLAAAVPPAMAQQQITKRANVAPDATVEVSNVQGSVTITTWDKNEVELVAELESDKDELEFEATERHVRIEVDREKGNYGRDHDEDANLTLRVPHGARLIVDTVSADIGVTGARGEQSLESVSGEVRTQAFDAAVKAASVSGEVIVTGNGGKAAVTTENVSGSAVVTGVRGSYRGEVVSGEITASVAAAEHPGGEFRVRRDRCPGRAHAHRAGRDGLGERHGHAQDQAAGERRFRHRVLQRRHRELLRTGAARHQQVHARQRAQLHPGQGRRAGGDRDAFRRDQRLRPLR